MLVFVIIKVYIYFLEKGKFCPTLLLKQAKL